MKVVMNVPNIVDRIFNCILLSVSLFGANVNHNVAKLYVLVSKNYVKSKINIGLVE